MNFQSQFLSQCAEQVLEADILLKQPRIYPVNISRSKTLMLGPNDHPPHASKFPLSTVHRRLYLEVNMQPRQHSWLKK